MSDKKEIGRCKDCKHFIGYSVGLNYGNCFNKKIVNFDYYNCSGLSTKTKWEAGECVEVGNNFGCVHWEEKPRRKEIGVCVDCIHFTSGKCFDRCCAYANRYYELDSWIGKNYGCIHWEAKEHEDEDEIVVW